MGYPFNEECKLGGGVYMKQITFSPNTVLCVCQISLFGWVENVLLNLGGTFDKFIYLKKIVITCQMENFYFTITGKSYVLGFDYFGGFIFHSLFSDLVAERKCKSLR